MAEAEKLQSETPQPIPVRITERIEPLHQPVKRDYSIDDISNIVNRLISDMRDAEIRVSNLDMNRADQPLKTNSQTNDLQITFSSRLIDNFHLEICSIFEHLTEKMSQIQSRLDQTDLIVSDLLSK